MRLSGSTARSSSCGFERRSSVHSHGSEDK
jgi:hypothetical protein